jgi:hypothetical protein
MVGADQAGDALQRIPFDEACAAMPADVQEDVRAPCFVAGQEQGHPEAVMRDCRARLRQQGGRGDHLRRALEDTRPLRLEPGGIGVALGGHERDLTLSLAAVVDQRLRKRKLAVGRALAGRHIHDRHGAPGRPKAQALRRAD